MSSTPPIHYKSIVKHLLLTLSSCIALFMASCGGLAGTYEEPVNEYFRKYTETAAIGRMDNRNVIVRDLSGAECISSESDKILLFYLRNPQGYRLNLQFLCAPDGTEVSAPAVQLVQNNRDRTVLSLTYSRSFLLEKEGGDPIGGTITLVEAETLREFDSYSYSLKCNTPPPGLSAAILQSADSPTGSGKEFVLCFYLPSELLSSPTHNKDTHILHISDMQVELNQTNPSDLTGTPLTSTLPSGIGPIRENGPLFNTTEIPSGYSAAYMYTGISADTEDELSYTLYITDDDGLSSPKVSVSTCMEKLAPPLLLVDGEPVGENGVIYIEDSTGYTGTVITAAATTTGESVSGTKVAFTITESATDYAKADGSAIYPYKNSPYALKIGDTGTYTLKATAIKQGYATSDEATYTFTVKQSANFYVSEGAAEDGNGTKAKPFKTVQEAIDALSQMDPDSDRSVCIFITGTVRGCTVISSSGTNAITTGIADSIVIQKEKGASSAALDGNGDGTVLTINTNVPLKIKNLKITSGSAENGGGIHILGSSKVSLVNAQIVGNTATKLGGGIYNEGILYLSGSTMIGNAGTGIATASSYGNLAHENGAGIYNKTGGKVYLGYGIDGEKTALSGGVCRNFLQNYSNSTALGGGIYNGGNVYFDTGNISYNFAYNGAGIYTVGNVEMSGGTIEGNEGTAENDAGCGAGVYVGAGKTLKLSGSAKIKNNKNMSHGAGVYLSFNGSKLDMNGGTISGNIAKTNGGAIYMHGMGSDADRHSHLQMSGGASIPYGGAEKQNDIFMLDTNCVIKVTGALSQTESETAIVYPTYSTGTQILTGNADNIASACSMFFVVKPESAEERLYLHPNGKLGPIIYIFNGENYSTETKNGIDYEAYRYSYLRYVNLGMSIINPYEKSGYSMEVKLDGVTPEDFTYVPDGYHTVYVKISKPGCETIEKTRYVFAKIKPVKYHINDGWLWQSYYEARGTIKINGETVKSWGSYANFGEDPHFNPNGFERWLYSRDANFKCEATGWEGSPKNSGHDYGLNSLSWTYKLSDIRATDYVQIGTDSSGSNMILKMTFTLTDD